MKEKFNLEELKKIRGYKPRIQYCELYNLKYLGEGSSRIAYLLPGNQDVIKLCCNRFGKIDNKREFKIYNKVPSQIKKHLVRIFECEPKGLYLITERLYNLRGDEFGNCPAYIMATTRGYSREDLECYSNSFEFKNWNKGLKLRNLTAYLEKNFGISDLDHDGNWLRRKSGKVVTCDFSYKDSDKRYSGWS